MIRKPLQHDQSGQGLIEFALVLPVFLLMIFGFISFAMVLYGLTNASYANHLLLRYACVHSGTSYAPITSTDITGILTPYMNNFPANTVTPTMSWGVGAPAVGANITTTLAITYHVALPGFALSPLTVRTTATGVVVQ